MRCPLVGFASRENEPLNSLNLTGLALILPGNGNTEVFRPNGVAVVEGALTADDSIQQIGIAAFQPNKELLAGFHRPLGNQPRAHHRDVAKDRLFFIQGSVRGTGSYINSLVGGNSSGAAPLLRQQ